MEASRVAAGFETERQERAEALAARRLELRDRVHHFAEIAREAGDEEHDRHASLILAKLVLAKVDAAWERANSAFPSFDHCPRCWIDDGTQNVLQDVGWTALMVHQSPRDPCVWGCAECRWSICVPPRSRS